MAALELHAPDAAALAQHWAENLQRPLDGHRVFFDGAYIEFVEEAGCAPYIAAVTLRAGQDSPAALLARAADWVKPGGVLAYGVCSLQPQEGEAQIDGFLKGRDDFTLEATAPPKRFTPDENMDGFYLALMHKGGDG